MNLSWLIIGGGIHGVHIAARLIGDAGLAADRIGILDPADELLARWRICTSTTGMLYLRSPSVHHLDLDSWSLQRFAGNPERRGPGLFARPYDRPSLGLFNAHCDRVIESHGLRARHVRGRASACRVDCDGLTVETEDGKELRAKQVVLAIGAGEQPEWPPWAPSNDPHVGHIFARGFSLPSVGSGQRIAVVGGGISAAQISLRLVSEGHNVHLISRHALRQHRFDSDPGWLGPKLMTHFEQERDLCRRRAMIVEARHRGSVPPDVRHALGRAIDAQSITWHQAGVDEVVQGHDARYLRLSSGDEVEVDRILLATGFSARRPGGVMLDDLIETESLRCAECGYPVVDSALRWHPRIYVSGPLAELELGPAARNIAGARRAGDRIVLAARSGAGTAPSVPSKSKEIGRFNPVA